MPLIFNVKKGLQANYDALPSKNSGTIYVTTDTKRFYIGDTEYTRPIDTEFSASSENGISNKAVVDGLSTKLFHTATVELIGDATGVGGFINTNTSTPTMTIDTTVSHATQADRASKLETYYQDDASKTYGAQYPLYAQWLTNDRLWVKCDGYPTEVNHAYALASSATNKNKTTCLLSVGDSTTPVYFASGVPVACTGIATEEYVNNQFAVNDAMIYKGVLAGTASSPGTYTPAAHAGWTYKVSAAGYINGYQVQIGDMLICCADDTAAATSSNYTTIRAKWNIIQSNIDLMKGATASAAGGMGLVPSPAAGENDEFLRGDGTWQPVITGVTAGNGLTDGGTSGAVTVNVGEGTGISVTADAVSLATFGDAGTYGPSEDKTLSHSGTFTVPKITTDAYGRVTASNVTYTLPSSGNTDTKVKQAAAITTNGNYPVILGYSTATTAVTDSVNKCAAITANPSTGALTATKVYGAVWNDYAEYRTQVDMVEPGYCVASNDKGQVYKTTEKYQACDGIVSDTFGFAIGETENCQTPLAIAGRVLAYCSGDRNNYHAGDTVCAGPDGKVMKMTREEIREWPDRIIGIVSEIPDYEEWGSGNVKVNNRIWIKIK